MTTRKSMTYGTLPTLEEFSEAFLKVAKPAKTFHCTYAFSFTNDPRVDTCELTASELWGELKRARAEWQGFTDKAGQWVASDAESGAAGDWCSTVLGVLGFEWI